MQVTNIKKFENLEDGYDGEENYSKNTLNPQLFFEKDLIVIRLTSAVKLQVYFSKDDHDCSIHTILNILDGILLSTGLLKSSIVKSKDDILRSLSTGFKSNL
jgi:hypothetical protein